MVGERGDLERRWRNLPKANSSEISDNLGLNLGAEVSYNQESDYNEFHNYELDASIDWLVTDQIVITPQVRHYGDLSDEAELAGIEEESVASLTVTLEFQSAFYNTDNSTYMG
jgi:hypothetical protein